MTENIINSLKDRGILNKLIGTFIGVPSINLSSEAPIITAKIQEVFL